MIVDLTLGESESPVNIAVIDDAYNLEVGGCENSSCGIQSGTTFEEDDDRDWHLNIRSEGYWRYDKKIKDYERQAVYYPQNIMHKLEREKSK